MFLYALIKSFIRPVPREYVSNAVVCLCVLLRGPFDVHFDDLHFYRVLLLCFMVFGSYKETFAYLKVTNIFLYIFEKFYSFGFSAEVCHPFQGNFRVQCEAQLGVYVIIYGYPAPPTFV